MTDVHTIFIDYELNFAIVNNWMIEIGIILINVSIEIPAKVSKLIIL